MYIGIIYKYTSPLGKVYIGQTTRPNKRRKEFLNIDITYGGEKINKAREEFGVNNFEYEIIFKVESLIESEIKELLNLKEIQYIKLFDSFYNGYKSNEGGGSGNYIRSEESCEKLSQSVKNYYKDHKSSVAKEVLQFDMSGNFIQEFESARSAAKSLNKEGNTITNVCSGKRNHAHGYIWRYKSDFIEVPNKIKLDTTKNSPIPVKQYDLSGIFIKEWSNLTIAASELGYSVGNFGTYCNGRNNHEYKGFLYYRGEKD